MNEDQDIPVVNNAEEIAALPGDTTIVKGNELTDDDLPGLTRLADLTTVYLDGCVRLGDGAFPYLASLPGLKVLYISGHGITDEGLALLTACSGIKELGLDANITGTGFHYLAALPDLTELHLPGWPELTAGGMDAISGLPFLKKLCFYGVKALDDEMLGRITGPACLEELVLMNCKNVTDEGADRVMQSLPDCMVVKY